VELHFSSFEIQLELQNSGANLCSSCAVKAHNSAQFCFNAHMRNCDSTRPNQHLTVWLRFSCFHIQSHMFPTAQILVVSETMILYWVFSKTQLRWSGRKGGRNSDMLKKPPPLVGKERKGRRSECPRDTLRASPPLQLDPTRRKFSRRTVSSGEEPCVIHDSITATDLRVVPQTSLMMT